MTKDYLYTQERARLEINVNLFANVVARVAMGLAFLFIPAALYLAVNSAVKVSQESEYFYLLFIGVAFFCYVFFYFSNPYESNDAKGVIKEWRELANVSVSWLMDFISTLYRVICALFGIQKSIWRYKKPVDFSPGVSHENVAPYIAILSDLHICSTKMTAEGHVPKNRKLRRFLIQEAEALSNASAIFICGDTTDTGHPLEWHFVRTTAAYLAKNQRRQPPIFIAPGNHDLNITHGGIFSSEDFWYHARNLRLLRFLLTAAALNPNLLTPNGTLLVHELDTEKSRIDKFLKNPFHRELKGFDPQSLWDKCFPLFNKIGDDLYVVMDSNRRSSNIITNAIGEIGEIQLCNLLKILESNHAERVHIILHHHIFPVGRVKAKFKWMGWKKYRKFGECIYFLPNCVRFVLTVLYKRIIQPHTMRCMDAEDLLKAIESNKGYFYLYHGHRHIRNAFRIVHEFGKVTYATSSPSTSLGDETRNSRLMQYIKTSIDGTGELKLEFICSRGVN